MAKKTKDAITKKAEPLDKVIVDSVEVVAKKEVDTAPAETVVEKTEEVVVEAQQPVAQVSFTDAEKEAQLIRWRRLGRK